jgi:hypothetical protein
MDVQCELACARSESWFLKHCYRCGFDLCHKYYFVFVFVFVFDGSMLPKPPSRVFASGMLLAHTTMCPLRLCTRNYVAACVARGDRATTQFRPPRENTTAKCNACSFGFMREVRCARQLVHS